MDKWISVNERLPESPDSVLGYIQVLYNEYKVIFYFENNFYENSIDGNQITSGITHWMELPEPPK